ncbi:polysaccharide biosynthesis tyrosine autokinase [Williamsia deligens]|uniref:Polysaccharide biosynthesis tyrosine autokinase n=1 Tax=Williamsia deligens TaxID=321325 RepID=A0ABW3G7L5_9NOCA|nr:polysaccharide biosynthesis tyrosine autokinase [Williamsia deligens]MCP2194530.1 capsular exopolysaccharide family [Williamsia deligens]
MTADNEGREGQNPVVDALNELRKRWLVVIGGAVVLAAVALGYSLAQTPEYEAAATLYVTSGTDDNSSSAYQGSLASQQRVTSYAKLVDSDAIVTQALQSGGLSLSLDDAKAALKATSTNETVLLSITATLTNRGEAVSLVNAVSRSMTSYVTQLETPSGGGRPLAKLTLVSPARASSTPVSPKTTRNVLLGAVAGLILSALVVLALSRFNTRTRSEADLARVSSTPVLASVPADELLKRRGLIDFREGATAAAEAFRKLRTNLTFTSVDNPPKTIVVTSAVAVEGKTTTAMNLAAALVEAGKRVVLVDADLRRPQVDTRTGLLGEVGFTNFLRGDGVLNDLVQPTQVDGLWILASGPKPPNPAELLGARRASDALTELAASFDYVIVDSPPVLPVTDAVVLAQWADGVVLVARAGSTKIPDLKDAYEQIVNGQTPVIGFVLTEAPTDKSRYGYYAVKPKRSRSLFGRSREPKAIENVLEPKRSPKH